MAKKKSETLEEETKAQTEEKEAQNGDLLT